MQRCRLFSVVASRVSTLCFVAAVGTFASIVGLDAWQSDSVPVTVAVERLPSPSNRIDVAIRFSMRAGVYVYRADTLFFRIADDTCWGVDSINIEMPPRHSFRSIDGSITDVIVDGQKVRLSRSISDSAWGFTATLQYQACDSTKCFSPRRLSFRFTSAGNDSVWNPDPEKLWVAGMPFRDSWRKLADEFRLAGRAVGYLNAAAFLRFLDDPTSFDRSNNLVGKTPWAILLLVLLGGAALNLTPCVLPIIPLTLAVIGARAQSQSRKRGFLIGSMYGLGMAVAYGLLGAIVAATGTQFGTLNASPAFNFAIAAVFAVMALALFDIVHIDFTKFRRSASFAASKKRRATLVPVFLMGALTALLAGACVAPVVISVVVFAAQLYASGQTAGLLLPFLLGLGMALPWPFAGAGISFLPKPGKWMTWVKYGFGVMIMALGLWYGIEGVTLLRRLTIAKPVAHHGDAGEELFHSLEEGLAAAKRKGLPVLIDFWASWCKNCTAMDATTFRDGEVKRRLKDFVFVKYVAENPTDPAVKEILDAYGVIGLPTYVVLVHQPTDRQRLKSHLYGNP